LASVFRTMPDQGHEDSGFPRLPGVADGIAEEIGLCGHIYRLVCWGGIG
jgi:hypothetical protein